jgi:glycosyltransferase involved in cell wall biosynthesis
VPVSAQNFGGVDAKRFWMFEEIVKLSGMKSNVTGQRYSYDTMQNFYHSIDALVCTSCSEGGPLGVFEAIACGIPVISTDVGLVKEFDSIPKFKTVEEAVDLVRDMEGLNTLQYEEMVDRMSMECLSSYWELFFRDCERLNTGRRLFF